MVESGRATFSRDAMADPAETLRQTPVWILMATVTFGHRCQAGECAVMEGATGGHPTNRVCMELFENSSHSFVLKLWLEDAGSETDPACWRGHVTHVPSGERRYFQDLNGLLEFLIPYLEGMGVEVQIP